MIIMHSSTCSLCCQLAVGSLCMLLGCVIIYTSFDVDFEITQIKWTIVLALRHSLPNHL